MHKLVFSLIFTIFCYDFGGIFYVNGQNTAGQIPCSCTDCSDWILSTTEFAQDGRLKATIANGFVGFRVTETAMHVNGFYHGYLTSSTRVRIPNHLNLPITFAGNKTYSLNMQKALFEELIVNDQLGVNVSAVSYASLADKHFLVTEITIQSRGPIGADVNVGIQSLPFQVTGDINVTNDSDSPDKTFHIFQAVPSVLETENVSTPNLTTFTTNPPQSGMITLSKGQTFIKFVFYSAITINNYTLAQNLFNQGKNLAKTDANGTTGFMSAHVAEWNRVWQNRFEINGNCDLAGKMRATYYYILSSLPIGSTYGDDGWPFFGISPGSLVNDDGTGYHGHVFWDQDLWMLIGLLPLHPEVVKQTLIDSRIRHIEPAKLNAQRFGYDGLMYPWELAYSGYECDPSHETAVYEIHVTGDSALCAQQYLQLTGDKNFAQMYYNTSLEIAKFYNSILKPTQNTYLGIYNIMGPDEYHSPVNNSAYMNSIAKIALGVPSYIKNTFSIIGDSPDPNWNQNMGKIYLPFDNTRQYHPEFDSYTSGTVVKQADTVLLGYPLLVQMDPVVRKNDLIYYQSVTDGGGPAMTWAMHSIGWLEYGAEKNASDMFKKNFNYMRAPFNIWTETTSGVGSVNFVTGMGGFMHNLLQGYLGLRIYPDRLEFNPFLIPDSGSYSAIGVVYQGMSFTFDVNDTIVQVSLISAPKTGCVLVDENGKQFGLNTGVVFTGAIKTKRKITCNPSGSCSCPSGAWYQSTINPCNCYNFVKTPKDWKSANNDCQQQNSRSTLASIDSAFENNEVLVKGQNQTGCTQLFIGLQEPSLNVWTWINNDTATYRNWRSGYPDTNVNNKCSQLNANDGKWTNIDCSTTGCYVCEIKNN